VMIPCEMGWVADVSENPAISIFQPTTICVFYLRIKNPITNIVVGPVSCSLKLHENSFLIFNMGCDTYQGK
jgi:hypothetical protein